MNNPENLPAEPERSGSAEPQPTGDGTVSSEQATPSEPGTAQSYPPFEPHAGYPQAQYPAGDPSQPQPYAAQSGNFEPYSAQAGYPQPSAPAQQEFAGSYPQGYQGSQPQAPVQNKPRRPRVDENGVAYGVGPFTLREAIFIGLAALVLISSFFPFIGGVYADLFGYTSLWAPAPWLAIPGALLLTAAAVLMVLRRVRPGQQRLRVGSLSVDQFASAMAITTAGFYVGALFLLLGFAAWFDGNVFGRDSDVILPGPGLILGLIFSLASLVPTTFAPFTAPLKDDFAARSESPAHPLARDAAPVARRPRSVRPEATHGQEVHSYSQENTGSVQLTPADARPEDFAAYRRKSWSPTPAPAATETSNDLFAPLVEEEPTTVAPREEHSTPVSDAPEQGSVLSAESAPAPTVTSDDDEDEVHFGDEPAPVSAIRHVAEQETLGDADAAENQQASVAASNTPGASEQQAPHGGTAATPPVVSTQPFWVYSPVPLPIVDETTGEAVFEIGPSAWALAIVDRGSELVIRHDDGRVGVLRQLTGIMRG
jgi:hypothetical protein